MGENNDRTEPAKSVCHLLHFMLLGILWLNIALFDIGVFMKKDGIKHS